MQSTFQKDVNAGTPNKNSPGEPWRQSLDSYLQLLQKLGTVYQYLTDYKCSAAVDAVLQVPEKHYYSGTVLAWVGRCHLELANYPTAFRTFYELRQLEPWQLRGMEYYSTALWYLQKDMTLSSLAADLLELDRNAPEPWCAAGNCFSLQREHEMAIRFFHRALQVSASPSSCSCSLLPTQLHDNGTSVLTFDDDFSSFRLTRILVTLTPCLDTNTRP